MERAFDLDEADEAPCRECEDRKYIEMYVLKVLNSPSRLYVVAKFREVCPYCSIYG